MAGGSSDAGAEPDLDALRRRVYGPDATDEDRDRYRARMRDRPDGSAATVVAPAPPASPPGQAPQLPRRRGLLLAGALLLIALGGIMVGLAPREEPEPPSPSPQPIALDGPTRGEFVQNLAAGNAAGIAAYLVVHRPPEPLRTATRLYTIEQHGSGPQTFSLSGTPVETGSGRATVFLVLAVEGRAAWTAYRARPQDDDPSPLQAVERRSGDQQAGVLTSTTFRYAEGGRPVRLAVDVPAGVRWGAAVVFSD